MKEFEELYEEMKNGMFYDNYTKKLCKKIYDYCNKEIKEDLIKKILNVLERKCQ